MRTNLKVIRENAGLTQKELSQRIGISRSTYTNIELGEKNPSLNVALKLKNELNYYNDDIFLNSNVSN